MTPEIKAVLTSAKQAQPWLYQDCEELEHAGRHPQV